MTRGPLIVALTVAAKPPTEGVLLAGGANWNGQTLASAEVWHPQDDTITLTSSMHFPRRQHTATVLGDGKILITGGYDTAGNPESSAELYDLALGTFRVTENTTTPRARHTATLLTQGLLRVTS